MVNTNELDTLLLQITKRYEELKGNSSKRESFLMHLRSLGHWEQDPMDYPDVTPCFPEIVHVAYAVCHPNCGTEELIIDGSTQECQHCGQLMFRASTHEYVRK
jgi:hypothetical protein